MAQHKNVFRHKITFQNAGGSVTKPDADCMAVCMAMAGFHTKAIARQLGFTPSKAQYRIIKGDAKGMRKAFREGDTVYANMALQAIIPRVMRTHIAQKVAPKFRPPPLP